MQWLVAAMETPLRVVLREQEQAISSAYQTRSRACRVCKPTESGCSIKILACIDTRLQLLLHPKTIFGAV